MTDMSNEKPSGGEKALQGKHKRRSSLSEAILEAEEQAHSSRGSSPLDSTAAKDGQAGPSASPMPDRWAESPWEPGLSSPFQEDTSSFPSQEADPQPAQSEPRKSGMMEAGSSPFTPEDSPVYELCADDGPTRGLSSPLGSVPEDEPAVGDSPTAVANVLQPEALQLPTVRTPRKAAGEQSDGHSEDNKATIEHQLSVDFSKYHSEDLDAAFNPFASPPANQPEAGGSSREERLFSMDMEGAPQADAGEALRPSGSGYLDFGSREGSGVVGPRLDAVAARQADKFQVKEGEDAEIKQLLWVIENLQEELHISNRAFGIAESQQRESQSVVDQLQVHEEGPQSMPSEDEKTRRLLQRDLDAAKAQEAEVQRKLGVMHSQLEGQLLTKLEQEEEIREAGMKLKQTRAEIEALDEQLAEADTLRKKLKLEAAEKRAKQDTAASEKKGGNAAEVSPAESPRSNYSSAWGDSSDSEAEGQGLDLDELQESRPPTSIFEDNQAKMTEKGGKGGSWLRSVLGGIAKKGDEPPPVEDTAGKREVFGAAHSHFERPATAAELEHLPADELDPASLLTTAAEQPPLPATADGGTGNLERQRSENRV